MKKRQRTKKSSSIFHLSWHFWFPIYTINYFLSSNLYYIKLPSSTSPFRFLFIIILITFIIIIILLPPHHVGVVHWLLYITHWLFNWLDTVFYFINSSTLYIRKVLSTKVYLFGVVIRPYRYSYGGNSWEIVVFRS